MGSTTNNGYIPNTQSQLSYLVQWFHEWSEMQRNDFLPILSQKFANKNYVNGLLPGMDGISNLDEKPPSLFQCRVKLFREWSDGWTSVDKEQFINRIRTVDPEFIQKYEEEINSSSKPTNQEIGEDNSLQN